MDNAKNVMTTLADSVSTAEHGADRLMRLIARLDGELRGCGSTDEMATPVPGSIAGRASYLSDRLHRMANDMEAICSAVASEPVTQLSAGYLGANAQNTAAFGQQIGR